MTCRRSGANWSWLWSLIETSLSLRQQPGFQENFRLEEKIWTLGDGATSSLGGKHQSPRSSRSPGLSGVCLKALERRDNSIRRYGQELIELALSLWLELRRDLLVQVIKVTVQGPIHET